MTFGPDWEAEFSRLWQNSSISLSAIARQLCLAQSARGEPLPFITRSALGLTSADAAAHGCHGCPRFTEAEWSALECPA